MRSVFSLTSHSDWQKGLEEYFEETALHYVNFTDESSFKHRAGEAWSLGLLEPGLVSESSLYSRIPVKKLGAGECAAQVKFQGRLDLPLTDSNFQDELIKAFPESSQRLEILLIDDDREFTSQMRDHWQSKKMPVTAVETAANGLEGLEKLKNFHPGVLIVDLKMPVMGGIEFYKQLRKSNDRTPVLILTAVSEAEEIAKLKRLGCPVCIEKSSSESMPDALWRRALKIKVFGSRDLR